MNPNKNWLSLVTAGSARSAGVTSSEQVQATILVNNGNIQIGTKVKVSAKLYSIWPMTIKNSLAYCISRCNVKSVSISNMYRSLERNVWQKKPWGSCFLPQNEARPCCLYSENVDVIVPWHFPFLSRYPCGLSICKACNRTESEVHQKQLRQGSKDGWTKEGRIKIQRSVSVIFSAV